MAHAEPPPLRTKARVSGRRVLSGVVLAGSLLVGALGLGKPTSGWFIAACSIGVGIGLGGAFLERRWGRGLLVVAAVGAIAYVVSALAPTSPHTAFLGAVVLPSGQPPTRWTRLIPERDAALIGASLITTPSEQDGLEAALDRIYEELEQDTPLRPLTHLRPQSATRSDAFVHHERESTRWVVFLHGAGGNTAAGCWAIARAAAEVGWSTICPSATFAGHWWRGDGPRIVGLAMTYASAHGAGEIVLAGYSNGAAGAAELAAARSFTVQGIVLICGFSGDLDPRTIHEPTLVIGGGEDERFPAEYLVDWASRLPEGTVHIEPDTGHLLLVTNREVLRAQLIPFLRELGRDRTD